MGASDLRGVTNDAFSAYYKQQLGLTDQEWSALEACLRSPLPTTFSFIVGKLVGSTRGECLKFEGAGS